MVAATAAAAVGDRTSLKESAVGLGKEITRILVEACKECAFVVAARDEV